MVATAGGRVTVGVDGSDHDVVIVGAGLSGSILAKQLGEAGAKVLVLEAGTGQSRTFDGYQEQIRSFFGTIYRTPGSPYGTNLDALSPDVQGVPTEGARYFEQLGPVGFRSTYERTAGGTMQHWLGTCLRMLPEDFSLQTRFARGRDWPIGYDDLAPDYERAEWEIGVSADAEDQGYLGVWFRSGYRYPMRPVPSSWLDQRLGAAVDGMEVRVGDEQHVLRVRNTPAGRNSTPIEGYAPVGAVNRAPDWGPVEEGQDLARDIGERCQGNSACVPICPVQAKYNALKTLAKATNTGNVTVVTQAVASRVLVQGRRVTGIEYLAYDDPSSPRHTVNFARGRTYVLACHAVENAKLLLRSGVANSSDQVGRNLCDHPVMLVWGLMPERIGPHRGPLVTSGIEEMRGGAFRGDHAAFRIEVGNDGWLWPMGGPASTAVEAVTRRNLSGRRLRSALADEVGRQFRLGALIEQLPDPDNRVTIDSRYTDQVGLPRPVIAYDLDAYVCAGIEAAHGVTSRVFQRAGVDDRTGPTILAPSVEWRGQTYIWDGAGHYSGTHLMGDDASTSVVDANQRAWDHDNLHVVGPGSMPTMGTSNPSLTVAALAFRTSRDVIDQLGARDGRSE
jgi:choline dehydrogenase-like flavoprotein